MAQALVVVDMLYDFIDGTLACKNAQEAVAFAASLMTKARKTNPNYPILFICDHHPANHSSFKDYGGIWPAHCVSGTRGGEIHDSLKPFVAPHMLFFKGCQVDKEQYSGFEGVNDESMTLEHKLKQLGIKDVVVVGIATEYCVKATCLDLDKALFNVTVAQQALAYVDELEHHRTLIELEEAGMTVFFM